MPVQKYGAREHEAVGQQRNMVTTCRKLQDYNISEECGDETDV